jgi:hypothetical protein
MDYRNKMIIGAQVAVQMLLVVAVWVIIWSCCERNYIMAMIGAAGKACLWLINRVLECCGDMEDENEAS